jgi:NAD-dependent deacetylase
MKHLKMVLLMKLLSNFFVIIIMDILNKNIVVFTGAGVSADSGIPTFRDSNGLWHEFKIEEVATPQAWKANREKVLDFYNQRRRAMALSEPNAAHFAIAELENYANVTVITQNIDNLHERAGSTNVIHLHGEITKARGSLYNHKLSSADNVIDIGFDDINIGDKCPVTGSQLRPHIVWFGESVTEMARATNVVKNADIMIAIGSSLQVEPAAGLVRLAYWKPVYLVDPNPELANFLKSDDFHFIQERAEIGVPKLINDLIYL